MNKDRCQELIDKILRRSKVILDGLLQVATSSNQDRLKDVEHKLNEYKECVLTRKASLPLFFDLTQPSKPPCTNPRVVEETHVERFIRSNHQSILEIR
jgi:hypothetical protein